MDTRIQFRVDDETKRLAQQMAESQGRTLSDACRELTEQLAEQQRKILSQDNWLTEQVDQAFARFDAGEASFVDHQSAKKPDGRTEGENPQPARQMIFWEERSLQDREQIFEFLYQVNPVVAEKTDDLIEAKVEHLLQYPMLGVQRAGMRGRLLIITEISMIVLYWVEGTTIRVLRVLHQKQKFPAG